MFFSGFCLLTTWFHPTFINGIFSKRIYNCNQFILNNPTLFQPHSFIFIFPVELQNFLQKVLTFSPLKIPQHASK